MALSTPNSRPPSAIGTCMNELTPCVSTTQRRKRSLSSGVETYGSPARRGAPDHPLAELEAGAHQALGDAAARRRRAARPARVVARQQHLRGARQLRRLLDDRGVDGLEVDRGGDRPQRPVDQALLAAQAGLALEQLGALERQRGEAREHLDRAQVLGVERAQRRVGGDREHAERAPAGRPDRARDERGGAVEVPRELGQRRVEVLVQPRPQPLGARPLATRGISTAVPDSTAASVTPARVGS